MAKQQGKSKGRGKEITGYIKLQIPAGGASPSPPVGSALGQKGLNIMDFCKAFNDQTKDMDKDMIIPVLITVYGDKSFTFVVKKPPMSYFIKKEAGLEKASGTAGREVVAQLSRESVRRIADEKMVDMGAASVEAAMRSVAGSARSMGITVEE